MGELDFPTALTDNCCGCQVCVPFSPSSRFGVRLAYDGDCLRARDRVTVGMCASRRSQVPLRCLMWFREGWIQDHGLACPAAVDVADK